MEEEGHECEKEWKARLFWQVGPNNRAEEADLKLVLVGLNTSLGPTKIQQGIPRS